MRLLPVGVRALLLDCADVEERRAWASELLRHRPEGVADVVPAAQTVLLVCTDAAAVPQVREFVEAMQVSGADLASGDVAGTADSPDAEVPLHVPVVYDGPDLAEVAEGACMSVEELIDWHTGQLWSVDFTGFLPGFGYLVGDDPMPVPRRPSPRTRVPAGMVGLAGEWSGIYPQASPGGWQWLGRTDLWTFDLHRDPPALLRPGVRVQFTAVADGELTTTQSDVGALGSGAPVSSWSKVDGQHGSTQEPGQVQRGGVLIVEGSGQLLVEDLGRPEAGALGVGVGGALDRTALRLANRLVGNDESAAGLEVLGDVTLRALQTLSIAVTGARGPLYLDGRPVGHGTCLVLPSGSTLRIGQATHGLRYYIGVAGGVAADLFVGSRSSAPTTGLGPAPLRPGETIRVRSDGRGWASQPAAVGAEERLPGSRELTGLWGPRADWLTDDARATLISSSWLVGADSDRVGIRLSGPELPRNRDAELPSEGIVRGSVQVPPQGGLVVFGPDHPITGGYPVVAVLDDAAVDLLAQARPGEPVRLRLRRP